MHPAKWALLKITIGWGLGSRVTVRASTPKQEGPCYEDPTKLRCFEKPSPANFGAWSFWRMFTIALDRCENGSIVIEP